MAVEPIGQRLRQERRVWRLGLLLSVLIHLSLLLLFQTGPERLTPYAAAGPASGDALAAPGGGSTRAVLLRPPVEIRIPPRPETPIVEPVQLQPQELELAFSEIELRDPGESEREGAEAGPGLPGGEGRGDAGNAMSGLRRLIPPVPRGVIMAPLDRPASVRGREVTVWVFINQAGQVDSVRLDPATPDRGYNEKLTREARDWVFEPALRAGRAVATWYSYTWKL